MSNQDEAVSSISPEFLSENAAATYLSISNKSLQRYRTHGGGPPFCKLGGRVVYPVADLKAWALERRHLSTSGYLEGATK